MELVTWHNLNNVQLILKEGFKPSFRTIEREWPIPHRGEWVHFYGEVCVHPYFGAASAYGGDFPVGIVVYPTEYMTYSNGDSLVNCSAYTADPCVAKQWVLNKHPKKYVEFQSWAPLHKVEYFYLPKWLVKSSPPETWEFLLDYAPVVYMDYNDQLHLVEVVIK